MIEQDFIKHKKEIMNFDRSIRDIEIIEKFGWRGCQEMILRIVYKGGKRLITTVHENTFKDELSQSIFNTRKFFREEKLERILDGE